VKNLSARVTFDGSQQAGRVGLALSGHSGGGYESQLRSSLLNSTPEQLIEVYSVVDIAEDIFAIKSYDLYNIYSKFDEVDSEASKKICAFLRNHFYKNDRDKNLDWIFRKLLGSSIGKSISSDPDDEILFILSLIKPSQEELYDSLWKWFENNRCWDALLHNYSNSSCDHYFSIFRALRDCYQFDNDMVFSIAHEILRRMVKYHLAEVNERYFLRLNQFNTLLRSCTGSIDKPLLLDEIKSDFIKYVRAVMNKTLQLNGDMLYSPMLFCNPADWHEFVWNLLEVKDWFAEVIDEYDSKNVFVTALIQKLLETDGPNRRRAEFLRGLSASEILLIRENAEVFLSIDKPCTLSNPSNYYYY
jgi:hypothetical protein